jgi:nitrogen-specific signal transduction histidine kinase
MALAHASAVIDAIQNASRSKESEAAERLSRELSQPLCFLLSNLHAVRNRLECDGPPSEDVARWVDGAFACANHIARLVVGISAQGENTPHAVELRRVLESTVSMSELELRGRAQLVRRFECEPSIEGSESRLTQAFLALMNVVAVGLPPGRPKDNRITVGLRKGEDGHTEIEFLGQTFAPVLGHVRRPPLVENEIAQATRVIEAHGGRLAIETNASMTRVKVWLPV